MFITGQDRAWQRAWARHARGVECLWKPFDDLALVAAITKAIALSG